MTQKTPPNGVDGRVQPPSQDLASTVVDNEGLIEGTSLWKDAFRRLKKNKAAMVGLTIVALMSLAAMFYSPLVQFGTRFTQEEQHSYVMPKPPMAFSVPAEHFTLMNPEGELAFAALDINEDGKLDGQEIHRAYKMWEFQRLDVDSNGQIDWAEYRASRLTMGVENIPGCERWAEIRFSRAPIEAKSVFECEAGEKGYLTFDDASSGRLLDIVSAGEAQDILNRFDEGGSGFLEATEFNGLPRPQRNWLGTDQLGRDLLTRLIYGGRISLAVGLLATMVSFLIGVSWGATAGFLGGKVDNVMMRIVDVMYGLPFIFLVILLMVVFGQNILLLFVALGAVQWLTMARIVRGQVISLKGQEFVEAAQTIGVSKPAIIFRHLIPNALGPIIVYVTLTVPAVMLQEAFLSFLGLGVQAPMTSWGALASEGRQVMEMAPWMIIFPGLALAVTLLSLNFLGDGLRDALDPQLRKD